MKLNNLMAIGLLGLVISHQAIAGVPGKPVMSWMQANYDNGANISSTWNMWWGTNGESWQLSANNHQICSGTLVVNEKNSQQAKCTFNLEAGIQELQVTLCNNDGCTTSDIQRISIAGSPNQPPQIALSVPATTNLGELISLTASASDVDGAVARVDFYANGALVATDISSPYAVSYLADTVGAVLISASATDNLGAVSGAEATLDVTACSNCAQPPVVDITVPDNLTVGDLVMLTATASDADGTIANVEIKLDDVVIATLTTAPFQVSWLAVAGNHNLLARATDNDGLVTSSLPIAFIVQNDSAVVLIKPGKPQISFVGEQTMTDGKAEFNLSWNMWFGENGSSWRLFDKGLEIAQGNLAANTPNAQSVSTLVSITSAGQHDFVVELCNSDDNSELCAGSNPQTVKVIGSGPVTGLSPWDYLDNSEWLARKSAGMTGKNVPYQNTSGKMVGAYFVEWGVYGRKFYPKDIPAANLTHLFYGFIPICGANDSLTGTAKSALDAQCANKQDYEVVVHDKFAALEKNDFDVTGKWDDPIKGIFAEMYRMKMTYPDLKIIPSVGGWTLSDPLYAIGTQAGPRAIFIKSIIEFIDRYDFFDGIDIDWEFPGGGGANPALGSSADGAGFATLMQELRVALDELGARKNRQYELTAAVSGGVSKLSKVDWERAAPVMDYINLMTYDYYGAWSQTYGHQTGIYDTNTLATPIDGFNVNDAVTYLTEQRLVPAAKLTAGVAMYGRGWSGISGGDVNGPFVTSASGGTAIKGVTTEGFWEPGIVDYKGIEQYMLGGENGNGINGYSLMWDQTAMASYLWNIASGTLITFDTARSVKAKGQYINA
ncbi:MAG: hypothetical protein HRU25_17495, partial [Psychrobium sp.]|nr:hypothetical protein [Psychrobium sp.]